MQEVPGLNPAQGTMKFFSKSVFTVTPYMDLDGCVGASSLKPMCVQVQLEGFEFMIVRINLCCEKKRGRLVHKKVQKKRKDTKTQILFD